MRRSVAAVLLLLAAAMTLAASFSIGFADHGLGRLKRRVDAASLCRSPAMRDHSTVTEFADQDRVEVTVELSARGSSLKGMVGTIASTWEKCEVDPTCCCAELGMEEASVEVVFHAPDAGERFDRFTLSDEERARGSFSAYFSPEELSLVTSTPTPLR